MVRGEARIGLRQPDFIVCDGWRYLELPPFRFPLGLADYDFSRLRLYPTRQRGTEWSACR